MWSARSHQGGWSAEIIQCLGLALPLALTQVAQAATNFVDTAMLGMLGSSQLAAGGLGSMLFMFLWILGINVVGAINPLIAAAYGAGRSQAIAPLVEQGVWLAFFLSLPITGILLHPAPFLQHLGQEPQLIQQVVPYLQSIAWGYFPALLFAVQRNFVSALSQPRSVLMIMVVAVGVNAIANYGLMFGRWGLPALGIAGVGWASTITYWSMAIALTIYVLAQPAFQPYQLFTSLYRFRLQLFKQIVALGLPMGALALFEAGLFTAATVLAAQLGVTVLAAHQIALQTVALTFMVPLGISYATTVRVGQYWGQRNLMAARRAGYVGLGLGAGFMSLMAIALLLIPRSIISLYLDIGNPENQAVVQQAIALLAVGGMFQLVDGIQVIAGGALKGLQDTKVPMMMAGTAYWGVGLPVSYFVAFRWGWGGVGLWLGLASGLAIAALCLTGRFHHQITQHIVNQKKVLREKNLDHLV
ncbi:MAG: MATE family efflux transporter [Cyanothece sp. SIO2G6]|nr:MATE family efflux transporter [Cyanothece sp. SIO2G6]